jgi:hypothetical protein
MINYYFFQFIKKNGPDRTGPWTVPSCLVGVRPLGANGGTGSIFSNLNRLGPAHMNRAGRGPWTAQV